MGFDTYLTIDGSVALMWRKYASALPRLLFRQDQAIAEMTHDATDDSSSPHVTFTTSVDDALANLADAGFGWRATVAAYAEMRIVRGHSSGLLVGSLMNSGSKVEQTERSVREFEDLPPEVDLRSLGRVMTHSWNRKREEEVLLLGALSYDGDLPPPNEASWNTWRYAEEAGLADPFAAARAAENLALLDRSAPLLLWPLLMCIFLAHLPPTVHLVLDLSEDASQSIGDADFSIADYPARYWERATKTLAGEARVMGRLWGVLASVDSPLGKEYWFARASELLERVELTRDVNLKAPKKLKGDALEALMEALLRTEQPELVIVEKNFRTAAEEIDILVSNSLTNPFWLAQGSPLLLIECKNWSEKVGVEQLRIFESKVRDRGALCKLGIFVSMSGFTKPFLDRLPNFQAEDGLIFVIDGKELLSIVSEKTRLTDWLRIHGIRRSLGCAARSPNTDQ